MLRSARRLRRAHASASRPGVHSTRARAWPECWAARLARRRHTWACTGLLGSQVQPRGRAPSGQAAAARRRGAEARAQAGAAPRAAGPPRRACATWPGVATTSWPACSSASRCAAGVSAASALTRRSAPQRAATASASSRTCPPRPRVSQDLPGSPIAMRGPLCATRP